MMACMAAWWQVLVLHGGLFGEAGVLLDELQMANRKVGRTMDHNTDPPRCVQQTGLFSPRVTGQEDEVCWW